MHSQNPQKKFWGLRGSAKQTQKVWIACTFLRVHFLAFELINYLTDSLFHCNSVLCF